MGATIFAAIALLLSTPSGPPLDSYELEWSDEFNGTSLDLSKWYFRNLGPRRDAVNVKDTVVLDGEGHLVLTTKRVGDEYHTAFIATNYETTFGYFECRVLLQKQVGHWSAFWLYTPTVLSETGNTELYGTEIDIFEYKRRDVSYVNNALHWDGYKDDHKHTGNLSYAPGIASGWHTFGLLWTDSGYTFYVDRKEVWRTNEAISKRPEFMLLSLEVGKWAGSIEGAILPDSLYVDYVRVYKNKLRFSE